MYKKCDICIIYLVIIRPQANHHEGFWHPCQNNEQKKRKRQLEKQISAQRQDQSCTLKSLVEDSSSDDEAKKKRNQASSSSIIVNLSPTRAAIREQCLEDMTKQANSMQKLAQKANGIFDGNLTIGTNVLLAKPHIEASRMDTPNLSMVIVDMYNKIETSN